MLHWFFAVWEQIHTPLGKTHETAQKMVTAGFMKVKLDFERPRNVNFRNKLNGTQYINMVSKWKYLLLTMLQSCKISLKSREILKGIVHPKMKMWCLSAYRQGIQDVNDFVSSVKDRWLKLNSIYIIFYLWSTNVQLSWARSQHPARDASMCSGIVDTYTEAICHVYTSLSV